MDHNNQYNGLDIEEIVRPPTDSYRILHVDDDPALVDLTSTFLKREQELFEVVTETSASDGLDRLDAEDLDCIISDYDMPGMDGLEFLEEVRIRYPDLPFILFTGKGSEEIASKAIAAGVTDYLQKGEDTDQYALLANRIMNAIDRYHANQQMVRGFKAIDTAHEGIALLDEDGLYDEILPTVPTEGRWSGVTTYVREDGKRIQVDHALSHTEDGTMICLIQEMTTNDIGRSACQLLQQNDQ